MKQATLIDVPSGKSWNLAELLRQDDEHWEISIGRTGGKATIQLGEGVDLAKLKGKTKLQADRILKDMEGLAQVQMLHATITYQRHGWDGEGFYIQNKSKHPIKITGSFVQTDNSKVFLAHGCELRLGNYGPVRILYETGERK